MRRTVLTALFLLLTSLSAHAFQFTPIEAEFSLQANGRARSFELVNVNQQPVAIELSMHRRMIDAAGNEELVSASEEFSIYPEQVILMPEQRQSVRVQWLGSNAPEQEQAFRLVAQQLPVDLADTPDSGIRFLLRYMASVYIVPQDTTMAVEAHIETQPEGTYLVLDNRGKRHVILHPEQLAFSSNEGPQALPEFVAAQLDSQNLLAGHQRRFSLAGWDMARDDKLNVRFELKPPASN